ncbi:hypothetical protein, partial [Staphylococcus aureus]
MNRLFALMEHAKQIKTYKVLERFLFITGAVEGSDKFGKNIFQISPNGSLRAPKAFGFLANP